MILRPPSRDQTRLTLLAPPVDRPTRVVDVVWGFGTDLRCFLTDRLGLAGEVSVGQRLGEYNGTILQNNNTQTLGPIRSRGGWGEVFLYLTPKLHWHSSSPATRRSSTRSSGT